MTVTAATGHLDQSGDADTKGWSRGLSEGIAYTTVSTATKDLFDFKPGWPATFGGIRALKDFSVPAYCTYADRMEAAGAILVGKTNAPVMGFRGTCDNCRR